MAGLIDPTVTGKYPVVLGDNLLGKTSNEIFTGVRCTWPSTNTDLAWSCPGVDLVLTIPLQITTCLSFRQPMRQTEPA